MEISGGEIVAGMTLGGKLGFETSGSFVSWEMHSSSSPGIEDFRYQATDSYRLLSWETRNVEPGIEAWAGQPEGLMWRLWCGADEGRGPVKEVSSCLKCESRRDSWGERV